MDEALSSFARPIQNAAGRDTESRQPDSASFQAKASETKAQRAKGRPKGSRNKPKPVFTTEFLLKLKGELTPKDYAYLEDVVKNGKTIDVHREMQIMFAVLGRNLLPLIVEETQSSQDDDSDEDKYLRKDVTERLKVWQGLGNVIHQIEKGIDDESTAREKPIVEIFARSGVDRQRIEILTSNERSDMGGDSDRARGEQDTTGTVPDQLPERQIDVPDSEQSSPIRVLDDYRSRDDSLSLRTAEL